MSNENAAETLTAALSPPRPPHARACVIRENLKADVTIFFPKPLYRYSSSAADRGTFRVVVVRTGRVDMCVECE